MANEPARITDNLLNVFNYTFVETVPYAFFRPNPERDIAVKLVDKEYHCENCGKVTHVVYQPRPLTYFSKGKLAQERRIYDRLGKRFPFMGELQEGGTAFTNEAIGLCKDCAEKSVLQSQEKGQKIVNDAQKLHQADELVVAKARQAMEDALKKFLAQLQTPEEFKELPLGDFNATRDFICAVMLQDTSEVEAALNEYLATAETLSSEIRTALNDMPDVWKAYAARSTAVYESMHDKLYHEYTVAFPKEGQMPEDYYIYRPIEKKRVYMFLEQPRIETLEELLMEVGFHGEWIELVIARLQQVNKEAKNLQ